VGEVTSKPAFSYTQIQGGKPQFNVSYRILRRNFHYSSYACGKGGGATLDPINRVKGKIRRGGGPDNGGTRAQDNLRVLSPTVTGQRGHFIGSQGIRARLPLNRGVSKAFANSLRWVGNRKGKKVVFFSVEKMLCTGVKCVLASGKHEPELNVIPEGSAFEKIACIGSCSKGPVEPEHPTWMAPGRNHLMKYLGRKKVLLFCC